MAPGTASETEDNAPQPNQSPEEYPPPPEISRVETAGDGVGEINEIHVKVKYYVPGDASLTVATVGFKKTGMKAELMEVSSDETLRSDIYAIVAAEQAVREHPAINGVVGINQLYGNARDFNRRCESVRGQDNG